MFSCSSGLLLTFGARLRYIPRPVHTLFTSQYPSRMEKKKDKLDNQEHHGFFDNQEEHHGFFQVSKGVGRNQFLSSTVSSTYLGIIGCYNDYHNIGIYLCIP